MDDPVAAYSIGNIQVRITETDHPDKLKVTCNDGSYRSEFSIRRYEYRNYRRHMNQRIKDAFKEQHDKSPD